MFTQISPAVIKDEMNFKKINGCEISLFAKPNAIPRTNDSGTLDPSWGMTSGGGGSQTEDVMSRSTYDTDSDGKVDIAEKADAITSNPTGRRQFWGSTDGSTQRWVNIEDWALGISYDSDADGKVNAAEVADKLSGAVSPNQVWGTDVNGVQKWLSLGAGDMSRSTYDTNADGKVNAADMADKLSGDPLPNMIWGTDRTGIQTWLNINVSDIMNKSEFLVSGSSDTVRKADVANNLVSESSASPRTVYYKDEHGNVSWVSLGNVFENVMDLATYDENNDGKVNAADVADKLSSEESALYPTIYGKIDSSGAKFLAPETVFPSMMLKTTYDADNDGVVDAAAVADKLAGIDSLSLSDTYPSYIWGKYTQNGEETVGFNSITAMDTNIMVSKEYASLKSNLHNPDNITYANKEALLEELDNFHIGVDNSFFAAYLRTDLRNFTPKKGYSYILTGVTNDLKSKVFDNNNIEDDDMKSGFFRVSDYIWSGWNGLHGAKIRLGDNKSIAGNSNNILVWDRMEYDSEDFWSTSNTERLTIPGNPNAPMEWCRLSFCVKFIESGSTSGVRRVEVYKNGILLDDFPMVELTKTNDTMTCCMGCSGPLSISPNDYFHLSVYHTDGSALSIDSSSSYFAIEMI